MMKADESDTEITNKDLNKVLFFKFKDPATVIKK